MRERLGLGADRGIRLIGGTAGDLDLAVCDLDAEVILAEIQFVDRA